MSKCPPCVTALDGFSLCQRAPGVGDSPCVAGACEGPVDALVSWCPGRDG